MKHLLQLINLLLLLVLGSSDFNTCIPPYYWDSVNENCVKFHVITTDLGNLQSRQTIPQQCEEGFVWVESIMSCGKECTYKECHNPAALHSHTVTEICNKYEYLDLRKRICMPLKLPMEEI
ncbi:uncharacterized protein LOC111602579 [Drosophila hydei]|uniref:Uncharacterized protein LOC111602579 n=1 Tax=Drosophila hydei TaxID=7224 RepID=A0A6J1MA81_DROHY|nr:uncharacterized protein LOC111602579 [Drosophila hydei]